MSNNRYNFTEPKFIVNDIILYENHKVGTTIGIIVFVETHWTGNNTSYHIYTIHKPGNKRLIHVGEKNIIKTYKNLNQ